MKGILFQVESNIIQGQWKKLTTNIFILLRHFGQKDFEKYLFNQLIFYKMKSHNHKDLIHFLNFYNESFLNKDLNKVRSCYSDENDELVYFDNHKNNDTYTVDDHIAKLADFFKFGKKTESAQLEEIQMENIKYYQTKSAACICFYARYKSFPKPAVRSTLYLEKFHKDWKIKHAHYSFEPDK